MRRLKRRELVSLAEGFARVSWRSKSVGRKNYQKQRKKCLASSNPIQSGTQEAVTYTQDNFVV